MLKMFWQELQSMVKLIEEIGVRAFSELFKSGEEKRTRKTLKSLN